MGKIHKNRICTKYTQLKERDLQWRNMSANTHIEWSSVEGLHTPAISAMQAHNFTDVIVRRV